MCSLKFDAINSYHSTFLQLTQFQHIHKVNFHSQMNVLHILVQPFKIFEQVVS